MRVSGSSFVDERRLYRDGVVWSLGVGLDDELVSCMHVYVCMYGCTCTYMCMCNMEHGWCA